MKSTNDAPGGSSEGATQAVADFVAGVKVSDIPTKALQITTDLAINVVGITIGGSSQLTAKIVAEQVREMGGVEQSSVAGQGFRTSAPLAAYANGTAAHTFDSDDTYTPGMLHPSASILPAVLALAEARGATGEQALAAFAVGLEVGCRLSDVTRYELQEKGFHPTGTINGFGVAAGCAWLMGLDAEQVKRAIGIQVSLASGTVQNVGTMVKPLHAGNAAKNGMLACLLASKGFEADPYGLEGKHGFVNTFLFGSTQGPWDALTKRLGDTWAVIDPGLTIKYGPCHTPGGVAGYGTITMIRELGISPADIERIDFGSNPTSKLTSKFLVPTLSNQAKYSSPYIVAVSALDLTLGAEQFFEERINRPDVQDLTRRVTIYVHDELRDAPLADYSKSHIRIVMKDGKVHERWFTEAKGSPTLPFTAEELRELFFSNAKFGLPRDKLGGAYEAIAGMRSLGNVETLATFLRGGS